MTDIETYPDELVGGYYDGARLIGTRDGGTTAEYYNPSSGGIVCYSYDPDRERLDANHDPERPLPNGTDLETYIVTHYDDFDVLSAWARNRLGDPDADP